jgi:hypothetical protein
VTAGDHEYLFDTAFSTIASRVSSRSVRLVAGELERLVERDGLIEVAETDAVLADPCGHRSLLVREAEPGSGVMVRIELLGPLTLLEQLLLALGHDRPFDVALVLPDGQVLAHAGRDVDRRLLCRVGPRWPRAR